MRSERHAGGAAISVHWTDGPLSIDVQSITRQYEGAGFDGMIDMKHQREHWLKSDGTVLVRHDPGTNDSTGTVAANDNRHLDDVMPPDAERVRFAADYILAHRRITDLQQQQHQAEHWVYDHCQIQQASEMRNPARDKTDNQRVTDLAYRIVAHRKDGETLRDAHAEGITLPEGDKTMPKFLLFSSDMAPRQRRKNHLTPSRRAFSSHQPYRPSPDPATTPRQQGYTADWCRFLPRPTVHPTPAGRRSEEIGT